MMWAALTNKIKGWKTIIWSRLLILVGVLLTILQALDVVQVTALLPDRYKPFAPLALAMIGMITESLRWATTGRVGAKDE